MTGIGLNQDDDREDSGKEYSNSKHLQEVEPVGRGHWQLEFEREREGCLLDFRLSKRKREKEKHKRKQEGRRNGHTELEDLKRCLYRGVTYSCRLSDRRYIILKLWI